MTASDAAAWLAAIGTVGAVIVALWLARRADSERLIFGSNFTDRQLEIYVVNASNRPDGSQADLWRDAVGEPRWRDAFHHHGQRADYSLAGVLRGSRCGLRDGPSLGRFRPGGAGVRRFFSRSRGDSRLTFGRLAMGS
jgi:hypothetical protein